MIVIAIPQSITLTKEHKGALLTNEGATVEVILALPSLDGLEEFECTLFIVEPRSFGIRVDNGSTEEFIYQQGESQSTAERLRHNGVGSSLHVHKISSTKWGVLGVVMDHTWDEGIPE